MTKIERFEDLHSWQKARQMTNAVYDLTEKPHFTKDALLCRQIRDAAGSVMHNIAEGFDTQAELTNAYDLATEAKRLINGMITYLRKQE